MPSPSRRFRLTLVVAMIAALAPTVAGAVPADLQAQLERAEARLAELDTAVSLAVEDLNEAAMRLEQLLEQRDATRAEEAALAAEIDALEELTSTFVRSMYMRGPSQAFIVALGSSEVGQAGRDLAVIDRLSKQRHAELEQLATHRVSLDEVRARLRIQIQAAEDRQAELEAHRDRVERMIAGQRDEVLALRAEVAEAEREARERAEAEARAAAEQAAAEQAAAQAAAEQAAADRAAREQAERERQAEQQATASPSPSPTASPSPSPEPAPSSGARAPRPEAQRAVDAALSQLGKPYRYGAAGPDSYDCSGLTSWAWKQVGVDITRTSRSQYSYTTRISRSELQPGDLVFFGSPIHHVAMYIGNGDVVEAPYTGEYVRINSRSLSRSDIAGYGRVP